MAHSSPGLAWLYRRGEFPPFLPPHPPSPRHRALWFLRERMYTYHCGSNAANEEEVLGASQFALLSWQSK